MINSITTETGSAAADLKNTRPTKLPPADPNKLDRLPPYSIEAEQGVLGCILLSPNECTGECIEKLKARGEAPDEQLISKTLATLTKRHKISANEQKYVSV